MIFDAHVHLPWHEEYTTPETKMTHLLEMMEKNGISGALVIADRLPESNIGINEQVLEVISGHKNIFAVAGYSPLAVSGTSLNKIEGWLKEGLIKAVKLYTVHEDFYIDDSRLDPVIQLCVRYGVPLMFHSDTASGEYSDFCAAERVIKVAQAHPELTLVCCHCWFPKMRENWLKVRHLKNIFLTSHPSIWMKNGGKFIRKHPMCPLRKLCVWCRKWQNTTRILWFTVAILRLLLWRITSV